MNRRKFARIFVSSALTLTLTLSLSGSAPAEPRIQTERGYYLYGNPVSFSVTGVAPESDVDIYSTSYEEGQSEPASNTMSMEGTLKANSQGVVEGQMPAPYGGNQKKTGIWVIEIRQNGQRIAPPLRLKLVSISVSPQIVGYEHTYSSIDLVATGFFGFPNLYAHYILQIEGKPDRELKTIKVGALDPATGGLKVPKFPKFPFKPVPVGGYHIQFDPFEKYQPLNSTVATPEKPYVLFSTSVVK